MKKLILILILALTLSSVSSTMAASSFSVQYPSSFSLKVGDSATVTNYQNMKIELMGIDGISALSYPPQTKNVANIHVSTEGGCGPNADPRCLGAPSFDSDYNVTEGNIVSVMALKIKATAVSSDSAKFEVKLMDDSDTTIPPVPIGTVTSGEIKVCSDGNAEECSVCPDNRCIPIMTQPSKPAQTNPASQINPSVTLNLPKGEVAQSVAKVEANGNSSATYTVKTTKKARLFFLIPVHAELTYSVNAETGIRTIVSRPWWNFLAW